MTVRRLPQVPTNLVYGLVLGGPALEFRVSGSGFGVERELGIRDWGSGLGRVGTKEKDLKSNILIRQNLRTVQSSFV